MNLLDDSIYVVVAVLAVAGLGALGLTSAGTAALVGRRHRQQHRS